MAYLAERAGPVCWAVEKTPEGAYRKRLLLPADPVPPAALVTKATEAEVDAWIGTRVAWDEEDAAFGSRQRTLFEEPAPQRTPAEIGAAGAAEALANASIEWRTAAWAWLLSRTRGALLTSDDLTEAVGVPPAHPHAVGGIIKNAATAGYLAKTGQYVESRRESCRGAALAVWARTEAR